MLELNTINDILANIAKREGETVAMWKSAGGWKPIMGRTMYGRVRALVQAMKKRDGQNPTDPFRQPVERPVTNRTARRAELMYQSLP